VGLDPVRDARQGDLPEVPGRLEEADAVIHATATAVAIATVGIVALPIAHADQMAIDPNLE